MKRLYIEGFSTHQNLTFNGKAKRNTWLGCILSVIFFGLIGAFMVYQLIRMFNREEVKSSSFTRSLDVPPAFPLKLAAFGIAATQRELFLTSLASPDVFVPKARVVTINTTLDSTGRPIEKTSTLELELHRCSQQDYQDILPGFLKEIEEFADLSIAFCYDRNLPEWMINIRGKRGNPVYKYFEFEINKCETNCHPKMNEFLSSANAIIIYSDTYVDTLNFESPVKRTKSADVDYFGLSFFKERTVKLTPIVISTEQGFLITDTALQVDISFNVEETIVDDARLPNLYKFILSMDDKVIVFQRSYTTLQDVLGQITGIVTAVTLIILGILTPYLRLKLFEDILNKVYDDGSGKRIQIRIMDYVEAYLGSKVARKKLQDIGNKLKPIKKRLDIIKIAMSMINLDKFLGIALTKEQILLLDNIIKISPDKKYTVLQYELDHPNCPEDIKQAIETIKNKPELDTVDINILKAYKVFDDGLSGLESDHVHHLDYNSQEFGEVKNEIGLNSSPIKRLATDVNENILSRSPRTVSNNNM